eukprot:1718697-Amphidinium_carterae.1
MEEGSYRSGLCSKRMRGNMFTEGQVPPLVVVAAVAVAVAVAVAAVAPDQPSLEIAQRAHVYV